MNILININIYILLYSLFSLIKFLQAKLQNCKSGLKLSDNQVDKTLKSVLQMQTKCKGFLQKLHPYFCNALIINLMCKFFKLYEKCVFFARFDHFCAQNATFVLLVAHNLHKM